MNSWPVAAQCGTCTDPRRPRSGLLSTRLKREKLPLCPSAGQLVTQRCTYWTEIWSQSQSVSGASCTLAAAEWPADISGHPNSQRRDLLRIRFPPTPIHACIEPGTWCDNAGMARLSFSGERIDRLRFADTALSPPKLNRCCANIPVCSRQQLWCVIIPVKSSWSPIWFAIPQTPASARRSWQSSCVRNCPSTWCLLRS